MEGAGEGRGFFSSLRLSYLSTMSQQFCRRFWVRSRGEVTVSAPTVFSWSSLVPIFLNSTSTKNQM